MFTESDSNRQDEAFARIEDEFSRLQQQEKNLRKSLGLSEDADISVDETSITPEVKAWLQEAKEKAKREGAARAAQFKSDMDAASSTDTPRVGSRRQGIVRI